MASFMTPYSAHTYSVMRIVFGFTFLWHGMQKLFAIPIALGSEVPAFVMYVAGPLELIGGVLIMIGLLTRWAAFICSGLMAAAYWMAHGMNGVLPIQNHGELAVLYCFAFLFIAAHGPGIWSVDASRSGSPAA